MTADLAAFVFVPSIAWHVYRASRGLRTGVFKSLGGVVDRVSKPVMYWFSVGREFLLGTLFAAMAVVVGLKLGSGMLVWLCVGYFAVYIAMLVVVYRSVDRSNKPLERAGCAGRFSADPLGPGSTERRAR